MKKSKFILAAAVVTLLFSCKTPQNITYFQDTTKGSVTGVAEPKELTFRPYDHLYISVHSRDKNLSELFELNHSGTNSSSNHNRGVYTIDSDGTIDFPEMGKIEIAGKTREEVEKIIKSRLLAEDLIRDPVVTVNFSDLWVNVLGSVSSPGRKTISKDGETLLDIIADAGDVNLSGVRTAVKVMRLENGQYHTYTVDLTNATNVMTSPVYYVQPNDIVYVEPNDVVKRSTTPIGNQLQTIHFWTSLSSFAISIVTMVIALGKKF